MKTELLWEVPLFAVAAAVCIILLLGFLGLVGAGVKALWALV